MLATAIGLPRQLIAFISGYALGVLLGVIVSLIIAICGCAITFTLSRKFLRTWLLERYATQIRTLDGFTENDAFWKVVMLRFQPLGTNLLTNVTAGVSRMPAGRFLSASLLGYVPQMMVFALIGSGVRVESIWQLGVSLFLLAVSFVLGLWLLSKSGKRRRSAPHSDNRSQ